jgi:hypothetical protein
MSRSYTSPPPPSASMACRGTALLYFITMGSVENGERQVIHLYIFGTIFSERSTQHIVNANLLPCIANL